MKINKISFFGALIICIAIIGVMGFVPEATENFVNESFDYITHHLGVFYILIAFLSLIFVVGMTLKYGNIILGGQDAKKTYTDFAWAGMMFCTGIGGSMVVFSLVEPIYYLNDTPFGIEPMSDKAFEYAHMYGQFHWGILDWMLCAPLTIFVAYQFYNKSYGSLRIGRCISKNSIISSLIDLFCVFAIVGGISTSMGLAAPVINNIISETFNISNEDAVTAGIFVVWFLIYATSVWMGIEKGIKKLSYINLIIALVFIFLVFIISKPLEIIETELNSIGLLISDFVKMSLYTAPFEKSDFPQRWTVFYWALTLAYLPGVAVFTARISKGRTIKQLTGGMVLYGSLGTMLSFSVLGYYSLYLQKNNILNVAGILQDEGQEAAIVSILNTLPAGGIFLIIFAMVSMVFMATSIDSAVYVIASTTMQNDGCLTDPPRKIRIIWAIVLLVFAICLTGVGGLKMLQTASVITAFPMIFISAIAMHRMIKILPKEYCHNCKKGSK